MPKKNRITYNRPDPPFLRKLRERIKSAEEPTIDTKKQELDKTEDLDRVDENPTVVITEKSNLTKEEQEDYVEKLNEVKPQKILFKKPVKKDDEKNKRSLIEDKTEKNEKLKKIKSNDKKNNRLLSFDDEE